MRSTNSAIIYLGNSKWKDIENLKNSLYSLDAYFNRKFEYPIIIFHEDYSEKLKQELQGISSCIQFTKVKLRIPDWIDKNEIPEYFGDRWNIGYRHMCRFHSYYAYEYLRDFDYYWRLDTDSFLKAPINYDVFGVMKKNDYIHGYVGTFTERESVIKDLWEVTQEYAEANGIHLPAEWDRKCYQMNFDISKTDFWLTNPYKKYFDYLDKLGGIYKYRWGDIPIRTLALIMFKSKIHHFKDIKYQHQYFKT